MNPEKNKRIPLVQGPFLRPDGTRWWQCRVDSKHRIKIPKEILDEQDWRVGESLDIQVQEKDGCWALIISNIDAEARRADLEGAPPKVT